MAYALKNFMENHRFLRSAADKLPSTKNKCIWWVSNELVKQIDVTSQ